MPSIKVLIAEDEPITRGYLEDIVAGAGHEVVGTTPTAEDVLPLVTKFHPDVIIMDIHLKGKIDGIDAAARVRLAHDSAVVFLTAYADAETVSRARHVASFGYVKKPVTEQEVLASIEIAYHKLRDERAHRAFRKLQEELREFEFDDVKRRIDQQKMKVSERIKTEFIQIMSHDFRTPLMQISSSLALIDDFAKTGSPELIPQFVDIAKQATARLTRYVDDMLDLAAARTDRLQVEENIIRPGEVVRLVLDDLRRLAELKDCRLVDHISIGAELPAVWADAGRLRQVLVSVISNAILYGASGGLVTVSGLESEDDNRIRIIVSDRGKGIAVEAVDRLFQPFERLDQQIGPIEGLGLGLALSKEIMARMGGAIGYKPNEDGGATFWIDLPVWRDNDSDGPCRGCAG